MNIEQKLDNVASDIKSLDLTHYSAMYQLNELANRLNQIGYELGTELFKETI